MGLLDLHCKFSSSNGLLARCIRGGALLAGGSVIERAMRFIANMILARLLAPDQFGLMALILASNGLFETLTEVGIRQSIIQNKTGDTQPFLNVAWWFSSLRGVGLFVIGLLASPYVADFYGEPLLTPLLRIAFFTMLFNGLTNPWLYVLEKRLEFGRYVWIMQGSALGGTILCLGLAVWFPNVWALVISFVAEACFRCIASFIFCPFKVERRFDRDSWNQLLNFSKGMMGLPILTFLFMQADIFVLGKMCEKELLGLYTMALGLAMTPNMIFARVAGPMVLPVLSDMQDRISELRGRLLQMSSLLFLFGLPMTVCLAIYSKSILILVYGNQYAQVAGAFSLLSFYVLIYVSGTIIASTYIALGRPEIHRQFTLTRILVLGIIIYPAILWFGASGAAGARVLCMLVAGIVQQYNLSRLIHLPVSRYILTIKEGAILSVVLLIPAVGFLIVLEKPLYEVMVGMGLCLLCWGYIFWTRRNSFRRIISPATPVNAGEL